MYESTTERICHVLYLFLFSLSPVKMMGSDGKHNLGILIQDNKLCCHIIFILQKLHNLFVNHLNNMQVTFPGDLLQYEMEIKKIKFVIAVKVLSSNLCHYVKM